MQQTETKVKVQTVLGPVEASALGKTLVHEHCFIDMTAFLVPPAPAEANLAREPVSLENLWWVRLNPVSNLDNMKVLDEKLAFKETSLYKRAGGGTIVDMTTSTVGRDPERLARLAMATGLNIVMGCGYHTARSHPAGMSSRSENVITDELVREITSGVGDTGVRAGIIGEIGCSAPLAETERKVLRGCAAAQRQTGVALYIHPSPKDELALEITQILREAGADLKHVVIGHCDISGFSPATCRKIADAGCYIGFDNFGFEGFIQPPHEARVMALSDGQRLNDIMGLIAAGYLNKILVSQDVATRERLTSYGGTGYAHILRDVLPIMRTKGFTEEQIHALLVENPRRLLTPG
jgi:phosphotriesterase-related protein